MDSGMFASTTIPLLQEVVRFSQARHAILAGNIANLDTPGYKVRDLSVEDFQERLQAVIQSRRQPAATRSPGEPDGQASLLLGQVAEEPKTILYHDKSNVGIEHQVTEMVKNQMQHNLALSVMRSQFRLLEMAISERV